MEVIRKSAKFISDVNVPSDKSCEYQRLTRGENISDDGDGDGDANENVLFDQTLVKNRKWQCGHLIPKLCWVLCFAMTLLALAAVFVHFSQNNTKSDPSKTIQVKKPESHKTGETKKRFKKTAEWKVIFDVYSTESCIRLVDVDEDGLDDVIFAMADSNFGSQPTLDGMKKDCAQAYQRFPCAARVVALRGYDGKELWRIRVQAAPFMMNCHKIDVDKDGKADCIASGRSGTMIAFDPRKGKILWSVDQSIVHQSWNIYNVLVMADFTGDGVPEVLLSHGGDPKFKASEHKRFSGCLALVDGSNGRSLGRILNFRQYKETYSSPILQTTRDGSQYVLYGTGGETVKGCFLGISVPNLIRYVKNLPKSASVPNTRGNYTSWEKRIWYHRKHGVFVIYKSKTRGVIVSPTLVDMNNDGVLDIAMSAYDGVMRLYDGETLDVMWTARFHGFESYSSFAPAYFNDDDTLDFMFHLNKGAWPIYDYSLKIVLDGRNGKVLWLMNATYYEMGSDLVMQTTEKHRDAFVFRIEGVNGPFTRQEPHQRKPTMTTYEETQFHNLDDERKAHNRLLLHQPSCSDDMKYYETEFMIVDRSNVHAPNVVYQLPSTKYYFNLTKEDKNVIGDLARKKLMVGESGKRKRRFENTGKKGPYCTVVQNTERITGVLGDVDGDGEIDQVAIVYSEGSVGDLPTIYKVTILKINMIDAIKTRGRYHSKLDVYVTEEMRNTRGIKPLEKIEFRSLRKQSWTQYMGKNGDGIYRRKG